MAFKIDFLRAIGFGFAMAWSGSHLLAQTTAPKPLNAVLYVVDDQGTHDAGCYGNPVIKTPGLDQLAKHGTRFNFGFCTTASCSASRSVILTGLYNHANGQYGHQHGYNHFSAFKNVQSLPILLSQAGYRTANVGKYHVAPEEVFHFDQTFKGKGPLGMAESCRDFLAEDSNRPFFLYFCTTEPHRPFRRAGSDTFDPNDVVVPPYLPDIPECRAELANYYGSLQRADSGLKRLIELLQETGHWNDTLIVYISDNGIAFPGAKTTLYEPGMRLPCVVRDPHIENPGGQCNALVTWADITPTVLDYAGALKKPERFHGRSFRSVIDQENPTGWDEIYASHTFHEITMYYPMRVVRTRRYKLIWNIAHELEYPFASDLHASSTWQAVRERGLSIYGKRTVNAYLHRPEFELFDLRNDPHETINLADARDHAGVLKQMQAKLKDFQERTKDPWVLKWRYE